MPMFYVEVIVRILMALAFGGLIGFERQKKRRPAGLRTHILVCEGATLMMILSEFIFFKYQSYGVLSDPARLGAQVISGVGFLGAGTIMYSRGSVKGLTTAASLWIVACLGLTIGAGFYFAAIIFTAAIYLSLIGLNRISHNIGEQYDTGELLLHCENKSKVFGEIALMLNTLEVTLVHFEYGTHPRESLEEENKFITIRITYMLSPSMTQESLMLALKGIKGVKDIEEITV